MARRLGVEKAAGKYIVFSDQDDCYVNRKSLSEMVTAIEEDCVQIVQFGHYLRRGVFLKRKAAYQNNRVLNRGEMIDKEIVGILCGNSGLNTPVWNKIYCADVLKDAVKNIHLPLYYAEDSFLNAWAFLNERTQSISIRNEAHYVWKVGIGFSSGQRANDALCRDYEMIKEVLVELFRKNGVKEKVIQDYHTESLYFIRAMIMQMIYDHTEKENVLAKIRSIDQLRFVCAAKDYIHNTAVNAWEELVFLSSEYTAEEYYLRCVKSLECEGIIRKAKRMLKKVIGKRA